jgi:large subunit ribosomal protein L25
MATYEFEAKPRKTRGKSWARALRSEGKLPAVVYGRGEKSMEVEVSGHDIPLLFMRTVGKNTLLTMKLKADDGKVSDTLVMFKDVQREPVKDRFLHVDFYHVDPAHPIKLKVPVVLEGTPAGVKELGGILNHPTRTVLVRCLPNEIPSEIKVDVSNLALEASILLKDIAPPKGVTFLSGPMTVLAHISEVVEEKAPEPAAVAADAAAGSPEVLKEKKPGEADAAAKPGDAKAAAPAADAKGAKPAEKGKK